MYNMQHDFYSRIQRGYNPNIYVVITTDSARRIYSSKQLDDAFDVTAHILDGEWTLDGSVTLGGGPDYVVSKEPRVLNFDRLKKSLSTKDKNLLVGYQSKRQNGFSVELNNADRQITALMSREPFITKTLDIYLGYNDITYTDHLKVYTGKIESIEVDQTKVILNAIED